MLHVNRIEVSNVIIKKEKYTFADIQGNITA